MSQAASDTNLGRLRTEADAAVERYKVYLASPVFQHNMDVIVLTKIAGDEKADLRERRRAAEVLAKLRLQAMEGLAELVAAREQSLDRLGIKSGGPAVAMTQVNNRIEIVRAADWRNAPPLEEGEPIDVAVLPPGSLNGHAGHDQKKRPAQEPGDARNGHEHAHPAAQEHDDEDPAS